MMINHKKLKMIHGQGANVILKLRLYSHKALFLAAEVI